MLELAENFEEGWGDETEELTILEIGDGTGVKPRGDWGEGEFVRG